VIIPWVDGSSGCERAGCADAVAKWRGNCDRKMLVCLEQHVRLATLLKTAFIDTNTRLCGSVEQTTVQLTAIAWYSKTSRENVSRPSCREQALDAKALKHLKTSSITPERIVFRNNENKSKFRSISFNQPSQRWQESSLLAV
jgi:hypothetical protein